MIYSSLQSLLFSLDAEKAHKATLMALQYMPSAGNLLLGCKKTPVNPALTQEIFGLTFKNPVGMAAGFDKNATAYTPLMQAGFGFVEVGTTTPKPQTGNPTPRLFRLYQDRAVINKMGFNNDGADKVHYRLKHGCNHKKQGVLGVNIGKNKDTIKAEDDYYQAALKLAIFADYLTINVSSPNTKGLRDLQNSDNLSSILKATRAALSDLKISRPILIKLAPDLSPDDLKDVANFSLKNNLDGLIMGNTTISRPDDLKEQKLAKEQGGLSGQPLFDLSTRQLSHLYRLTNGNIPIIGVGGIGSADDAYRKIKAGASLVQLYTAFVYQGPKLLHDMMHDLPILLKKDGFSHISEAVGTAPYK